ncbi:MAG: CBS domain-containing protein [Dehalococcoidia bacterium]
MNVRDCMKSPVFTVTPDTLIYNALETMREKHVRRLPVVENGKLVGLVTRNIIREATPSAPTPFTLWGLHYQLSCMKVRDVMITDVIVVHPDDTIKEVVAIIEKHRIGTFPVVDDNGNLVGILTSTDLLHIMTKLLD